MLVPKCIHMAVGPYFGFLLHHVCTFEEEGHVNHKIPRQKNKSSSMEWMTHNNGRSEGRAGLCPPKERKKELGLEMVCYEQHGHSLGTIWHTCAMPEEHEQ